MASGVSVAGRILGAWAATAAILILLGLADTFAFGRQRGIGDFFFYQQDLPVLAVQGGLLVALLLMAILRIGRLEAHQPPRCLPLLMCLAAFGLCLLGERVVYRGYGLSMDEFMAQFDAQIFAHGKALATVPEAWRSFAPALQPMFMLETQGHTHWASSYLPINAAVRGLARLVGAEAVAGPAWAVLALLMIGPVARRLWPDQPRIGLVAAVLLASSSQFLVAAMTPYAMPAHLALNLVWLWCFLRGGRLGHAGALATGFIASGLHQVIFHPLFVAPFVLQLWLDRRWRAAVLYTVGYGAICLFWVAYWPLLFKLTDVAASAHAGSAVGADWFASRITALLSEFDVMGFGSMAKNLTRFLAWQNLIAAPLAILGVAAAWRAKGPLRCMVISIVLTIVVLLVLLPYQGHGWGYRYLHGHLGSICLIAGWTWSRMTGALQAEERPRASGIFVAAALASVLILLPIHAWQANRQLAPYAAASAAIAKAHADVMIVDERQGWYTVDLVRNRPDLQNRPVVLRLQSLSADQVRDLCARHSVALFDYSDARRFGIRTLQASSRPATTGERAIQSCTLGRLGS